MNKLSVLLVQSPVPHHPRFRHTIFGILILHHQLSKYLQQRTIRVQHVGMGEEPQASSIHLPTPGSVLGRQDSSLTFLLVFSFLPQKALELHAALVVVHLPMELADALDDVVDGEPGTLLQR